MIPDIWRASSGKTHVCMRQGNSEQSDLKNSLEIVAFDLITGKEFIVCRASQTLSHTYSHDQV